MRTGAAHDPWLAYAVSCHLRPTATTATAHERRSSVAFSVVVRAVMCRPPDSSARAGVRLAAVTRTVTKTWRDLLKRMRRIAAAYTVSRASPEALWPQWDA